jgi:hypothetical protein
MLKDTLTISSLTQEADGASERISATPRIAKIYRFESIDSTYLPNLKVSQPGSQ